MWRRWAVAVVLGVAGCALLRPEPPPIVDGVQVGVASWYGPGFDGRLTASGEVYDQHALTAAHRTLALGTHVRVTSLANGRSVDVRINDRGPFVDGRVIDLSRGAAEALRMIGPGLMRVRLQILDGPAAARPPLYVVQVGAFSRRATADAMRRELAPRFPDAHVSPARRGDRAFFRVRMGPFASRNAARAHAARVGRLGYAPVVMQAGRP
jgi:rare lipoprotein A